MTTSSSSSSSQTVKKTILKWLERLGQAAPNNGGSGSARNRDKILLEVEELMKHVQAQHPSATLRLVQKALRRLSKKGEISKDGDTYYLKRLVDDSHTDNNDDDDDDDENETCLTAAEIMRQRLQRKAPNQQKGETEKQQTNNNKKVVEQPDIDEEIRRLEQELAATASEGNESDDDSLEVTNDDDLPETTTGVVCLSAVATAKIESLPSSCLPTNKKRTLKSIDDADFNLLPKKKKKKRSNDTASNESKKMKLLSTEGLKATVREVLDGYKARSAERLPFYCRVCAIQYDNEQEFLDHRQTDQHLMAVEIDQKASYCKLCRKQFTSPMQMKEHLSSRPHKERLEWVKSRQQKGKPTRPTTTAHTWT